MNHLSAEVVKSALAEIRLGERITLNLALDAFVQPMNPLRKPCEYRIIAKGHANDDKLGINTQGSSHWDGLHHYPYQKTLQYYNGVVQEKISGPTAGQKIGIQSIARRGITGQGVLLDWAAYAQDNDIKHSVFEAHAIPLPQLLEVARHQQTSFRAGDILFVRTGWLRQYRKLSPDEQALPSRATRSSCGVEASEDMIRWHWDNAFAAVASDVPAYEAWPSSRPAGVALHEVFLSGWGLPIGESFDLEVLADRCRQQARWSFFVVSVPLDIPGGVASPSNALAILNLR